VGTIKNRRRLSVVIITLNEAENIRGCLTSVKFADEVVVVDAGSTDGTGDVVREFTPNVYHRPMQGFGPQKQFAVEQATGDWILSLDADERLDDTLSAALVQFLESEAADTGCDGYRIYRRNIYLGRPIMHCGWYHPVLRLFKRGKGRFNDKLVHEEVMVEGTVGLLPGEILHEPYRDLFHHLEKMSRYARLDAQELIRRGRVVRGWQAPVHLILRPLWKFLEKYVWQQGFREGMHGLVLSGMAAFGVFFIHAHCWWLQRGAVDRDEVIEAR